MRAELGDERVCTLVRAAVAEFATQLGRDIAAASSGTALQRLKTAVPAFTAGDALDIEGVEDSANTLAFNVRGCRYAEYFRSIGEPLLGAMLTCEIDPPMTAGVGADLEFARTQTILTGGTHCDFRWSMQ